MKIISANQWIDQATQKEPWYQLSTISIWDLETKPVCFLSVRGVVVSFCLKLNTPTGNGRYTSEMVGNLTDEMINILDGKGMILAKPSPTK